MKERVYVSMRIHAIMLVLFMTVSAWAQNKNWVGAYYSGWELLNGNDGYLPPSAVDYTAITDVIIFSAMPKFDGTIDSTSNFIYPAGSAAVVKSAHAAGTKVLISVGGWGSQQGFEAASASGVLNTFVANLVSFMTDRGFDGIDLDWEPLSFGDSAEYVGLAAALRSALNKISPSKIMTTTCSDGNQALMAAAQQYFDQINIMTYDMSGNYSGWVSWYNSPIFNGGLHFPGSNALLPSIDAQLNDFKRAGVSPAKLGIGAELGGTVWEGLTLPDQLLSALTSISYDVPLYNSGGGGIMQKYYGSSYYHWDSSAQSGYLSIPALLGIGGAFISYDDTNSIKAKAQYIRSQHLGGIFLYELGMGYPGGGSYPMLQSVKAAFQDTTVSTGVVSGGSGDIPKTPGLAQNYPNPFNPSTSIKFTIPYSGRAALKIYDVLGREVATLAEGNLQMGEHEVVWNASSFPSGVYLCRLTFGATELTEKMLLLK